MPRIKKTFSRLEFERLVAEVSAEVILFANKQDKQDLKQAARFVIADFIARNKLA